MKSEIFTARVLFLKHFRSEWVSALPCRLVWLERGSEPVSAEGAPDDPETTIRRLTELRRQIETARGKTEQRDESGVSQMEREYEQTKEKLKEILQHPNVREQLRTKSNLTRLMMLDEIMPGALKGLFCHEVGSGEFGGKRFAIDMPAGSQADAALGLGMIDFREGGEGAHPRFVMVKKPDGTIQFGQRGIREVKAREEKAVERVGYYDIQSGDYLEVHSGYEFEAFADKALFETAYNKYSERLDPSDRQPLDQVKLDKEVPAALWRERSANESFARHSEEQWERGDKLMIELNEIPADRFAQHLMQMPWEDMYLLRRKLGNDGAKVTKYLKDKGVDVSMTVASELYSALDKIVLTPDSATQSLIDAVGGKEPLKLLLKKLAGHESNYKPFGVSTTACIGLFQFNRGNTLTYQINPLNTEQSVKGVIALMADNLQGLRERGFGNASDLTDRLLIAHNRGIGPASKNNLSSIAQDDKNPSGLGFVQKVMNTAPPDIQTDSVG